MSTPLSSPEPILAYFGGYAPAERRTYELFVVADGSPVRLISLHTGTLPAVRVEQAALKAAQGRPVRADELRDQAIVEEQRMKRGSLQEALDALLTTALFACHRGLALRQHGSVVGSVRLYGFTQPELPGGVYQAARLPDALVAGVAPDHPQLWTPGVTLARLPRRHHGRAAQETHPLWLSV